MANLKERFSGLFRPSQPEDEPYYDEDSEALPKTPEEMTTQELYEASTYEIGTRHQVEPQNQAFFSDHRIKTEVAIPYWLEDEDTLRDEGVLFGLSESDSTEKTEIIYKYFSHLAAELSGEVEQRNEKIQELNLFIGQRTNRIETLNERLSERSNADSASEHHLPRTLTGLALSIAMCVGNFYLIRESIKLSFAEASWIALGIFLAGMFNLFGRISLFHDTESKVSWRSLLEEVGLPFASALFVFAQVVQHQTWLQAGTLFIFVFFLFLFAGKLFLSNVTVLRKDLKIWLGAISRRKDAAENAATWELEVVQLEHEVDELRIKKWQVLRELVAFESERDRLYAKRDMLIKLFESEFLLARRMKHQLSGRLLSYIQKGKR